MTPQLLKRHCFTKAGFFYATLVLAVVTIPLTPNWNSWALLAFGITAFFQNPVVRNLSILRQQRYWIFSALFFLSLFLSYWVNSGAGFNFRHIEVYASFITLPIVFTVCRKISPKGQQFICYSFVATVLIVSIICLVKANTLYQLNGNSDDFFYHTLAGQMDLNAIYLSNYCLASLYWLLYFQLVDKEAAFKLPGYVVYLICLYLFCLIVLLSSKLVIFLMVISLLAFCVYAAVKRKAFMPLILFGIILSVSLTLVFTIPFLKERIAVTEIKTYSDSSDDSNGFAARLLMWQSALELIKEQPLIGYGIERSKQELVGKYEQKGFGPGVYERYNSHNQYLETALNGGMVSLVLLFILIGIPLAAGIKTRNFLLISILLHFMLESMVEATLTVQQQLVFFWLFAWIFYFNNPTRYGNKDKRSNHNLQ